MKFILSLFQKFKTAYQSELSDKLNTFKLALVHGEYVVSRCALWLWPSSTWNCSSINFFCSVSLLCKVLCK